MISFQNTNTKVKINEVKIIRLLNQIILSEKKKVGDIVYVFCDDNYLLKVNIKYLKKDYFTDIITFDYCEKDVVSGDIIISAERVVDNAKKFCVPFSTELNRVIIHGLLHLLGYNDHTDNEKEIMRKKENYYILQYN